MLVVAVRADAGNRHAVDAAVLAALGPKGHVVNIARGSVIDEAALIAALRSGTIAGAGLDVFEHEPNVPDELLALPNVALTPHIAGGTLEAQAAMQDMVFANLDAFFAGRPPLDAGAGAARDEARSVQTQCCIAGGGPAGMMLGLLLARAGVDVVVLEKHADFLRDFRGDTIHPSTLDVINELGLLERFLRLPHQEVTALAGKIGGVKVPLADFSHLPTRCRFIAMMPQWDFLDFLAAEAARLSAFPFADAGAR